MIKKFSFLLFLIAFSLAGAKGAFANDGDHGGGGPKGPPSPTRAESELEKHIIAQGHGCNG